MQVANFGKGLMEAIVQDSMIIAIIAIILTLFVVHKRKK